MTALRQHGIGKFVGAPDDFTGPVNLGNPDERSILELAQTVIELTGSKSKIIHAELPQDDPLRRRPDISLAREKLSWGPTVDLREGLQKTVAYFDALLSSRQTRQGAP